jgi:hypothetical protein
LVTGDELNRRVDSLSDLVNNLEELLQRRFEDLPDMAPDLYGKDEQAKFLEATLALRDRSTFFTEQMKNLINEAGQSGFICRLIPRTMDHEGHFVRFMDRGNLTFTVSLQPTSCVDFTYSRLSQATIFLGAQTPLLNLLQMLQQHQGKGMHKL